MPKEKGGRATPKGTTAGRYTPPQASGRYTPPIPREMKVSPTWVPVLMFTFLLGGMIMIVLNYLSVLPGSPSNWYLLGGLGCITAGFVTATQLH
jgi:hypothetical protein